MPRSCKYADEGCDFIGKINVIRGHEDNDCKFRRISHEGVEQAAQDILPFPTQPTAPPLEQLEDSQWICKVCTFINSSTNNPDTCDICGNRQQIKQERRDNELDMRLAQESNSSIEQVMFAYSFFAANVLFEIGDVRLIYLFVIK